MISYFTRGFVGLVGAPLALLFLVMAGILAVRLDREQGRHTRTQTALREARAAHQLFTARVQAAALQISAAMRAKALRLEREQNRISQEASNDYQARISDLQHRVAALRVQQNATDGRNPDRGGADLPKPSGPAARPDGTSDNPGFSLEQRIVATEQAIRLEELQRWIRQQRARGFD